MLCKYLFPASLVVTLMIGAPAARAAAEGQDSPGQAAPVTYTRDIQPLFQARCAGCHGDDAPEHREFRTDKEGFKARGLGPRLDSYTHLTSFVGWPDTGALMRRLDDGASGKQGNMFQYLGDDEPERQANLLLFKGWVGNWSTKRWKDTSQEEIEIMLVPY